MKQIGIILLGLSMVVGTAAAFGQPLAGIAKDQPKVEKNKVEKPKVGKAKNETSNKDQAKGKGKANKTGEKRKAEEPKAQ